MRFYDLQAIVTNHYLTDLFVVLFWNSTENQYHFVALKSFVFGDYRTELENSKNIPAFSNPVRVTCSLTGNGVISLFPVFLFLAFGFQPLCNH